MSTAISTRLVDLRKDRNLSQKDAAKALGVSQALLSHYEKGIRECGLDFLCNAASFYDVSADYLLGRSESRISSDALFDLSDMPQDSEMKMRTIFRASVMLLDKMSGVGNKNSEKVRTAYVLTLYKVYLCALGKGILPANSNIHLEVTPYLSSSMLDYILSTVKAPESKPKKNERLPLCIDTVVREATRLMDEQIQSLYDIAKN